MEQPPSDIQEILEFEQQNWVHGSVVDDPFYNCPQEAVDAPPGTSLKVDKDVDTSKYLIPASCALSRFIYQSETLNGAKVPVSAYVLWPYSPRSHPDGYQVVAWAHGTSGFDANAAPSHHKNLQYHFLAPYQIAIQGYVVVATDYAGLGVQKHHSGQPIPHEYISCPSQANDVVHSVTAAQAAFPELSKSFVVIGHSQGGGAAWAIAQKAALTSIPGYLGAISVSPYTNILELYNKFIDFIPAFFCPGLTAMFPDFKPEDMLTAEGRKRLDMVHGNSLGTASAFTFLSGAEVIKPDWRENKHMQQYLALTSNGGKPIQGPLLIIHGSSDPILDPPVIDQAVKKTAELFPSWQIEYVKLPDVTHVSALPASQRLWIDWSADRFAGRPVEPIFRSYEFSCARPATLQQPDVKWYLETATKPFQATGP